MSKNVWIGNAVKLEEIPAKRKILSVWDRVRNRKKNAWKPAHCGVSVKAGGEAGHGEEGHRPGAVDPPPGRAADPPSCRAAGRLDRAACPPRPVWAADPVKSSVACHFTTYCRCQMTTGASCLSPAASDLPRAAVHCPGAAPW